MPNKIKPKRSYTANAVPTTSDLDANELAINWADGKAFTKTAAGNIVSITLGGSGGGGGAVEDSLLRSIFVPPAPTGLTAVPGNASAALSWTAPTGVIAQAPITDYREQYSTDGGTTWTTFTGAAASTATTANVTGLTNGTAHQFRVAAVNAVGVGAYTAASSAVTPVAGDPLFGNVSLLLHMDGTGSTFIDSSPLPKTITAVGNATQSATQSRFGGKSALFDGSGDYLTVANSSGFTFAGDFTIEFFARFSSKPEDYITLFAGSSGATQMFLTTHSNGNNLRWGLSATAEYASGNFEWALNTWYHIAVRRQSGAVTLWVNGTNITSGSPSNTRTYSGGFALFGGVAGVSDFPGNIDEFRITQGVARTITVPTEAFPEASPGTDPLFSSVSLLLHADGTGNAFVDSSGTPKTVTAVGNATQSATQSKFGGKSAAFDGSGDYLTIPQIAFGTSDFALECWLYFNSISGDYTGIYDGRPGVNGNYPALLLNGSNIAWYVGNAFEITGSSLSAGQWYHVAVARSSGSTRMYLNGTQVGSTYADSTNYAASATTFIGNGSGGFFMNGFIDDLRVTVGNSRGYTGSTITVPTAAFPDSA